MLSARGLYACPGFIDVQINGAFGVDFSSPQLTKEDVVKVSRGLVKVLYEFYDRFMYLYYYFKSTNSHSFICKTMHILVSPLRIVFKNSLTEYK